MSTYYDDYRNGYYNPDDVEEQPGDNQNWKMIQKGFDRLATETSRMAEVIYENRSEVTIEAGKYYNIEVDFDTPFYNETQLSELNDITRFIMIPEVIFYTGSYGDDLIVSSPYVGKQGSRYYSTRYNIVDVTFLQSDTRKTFGLMLKNISDTDIVCQPSSLVVRFSFYRG